MKVIRNVSGAFTGGCVGSLLDSFGIWLLANLGLLELLGISMKSGFSTYWLYKRVIWGGIWMLLLLLPFMKGKIILRGMILSLVPSMIMIFNLVPAMGSGVAGLGHGRLMPVVVLLLNFIYGIFASYWYSLAKK
ncbi:MAG: hypothetical protein ABFR97_09770 [Thermodesulfobacteriota bacterium]